MASNRVVITGAAGLVGQNLVPRLKAGGFGHIVAIDKHPVNLNILRRLHPDVQAVEADLSRPGPWQGMLEGCTGLVIGHAQIGGSLRAHYTANNITATERLLDAALKYKVPYAVGISSSAVNSLVTDDYTESKKAQEAVIAQSGMKHLILRPTLMFGWFDRKHIGWLARFMQRVPVFPIPGSGRYLRQPLFAGDFCDIILSALTTETTGAYNISGMERVEYIDLMRAVKRAVGAKARIFRIPYRAFWLLLKANGLWDRNPAFTARQLEALVTPDIFEVIDWPALFQVRATPLQDALNLTFRDPRYSSVVLDF